MKLFFLWFLALCASQLYAAQVDLVVFSKNRPLQLYAFLESCEQYLTGVNSICVIYYRDPDYKVAYKEVKKRFNDVHFFKQTTLGKQGDFKLLTKSVVAAAQAPYIIFAVDDIVMTDEVDLGRCVNLLEKYEAYGFYLRLGTDITHCYMERRKTGLPAALQPVEDGVLAWPFYTGSGDWNYPHSVDMTLLRKKHVQPFITSLSYSSPNTFEGHWSVYANAVREKLGLCFTKSKMVNLPINLVQEDYTANRHGTEYDAEFLLEKFKQGLRLDISALHQFPHHAPHAEYVPTFIMR